MFPQEVSTQGMIFHDARSRNMKARGELTDERPAISIPAVSDADEGGRGDPSL
jgi:hypothetical protein